MTLAAGEVALASVRWQDRGHPDSVYHNRPRRRTEVTLEVKNIDKDADVRAFDHGKAEVAKAGNVTVGRATLEPGWRWSNDVKPIAKTDSCQVHHKGYVISGRIHVVMDDGAEGEAGPGDVYEITAGHDAWVVGDKPYVAVDFSEEIAGFAKPS